MLNAPLLLLSYLGKMLLPVRLLAHHVFEPITSAAHPGFLLALPGVLLMVALVLWMARRAPDLAFAASLACLPLLPVLYVPALGTNAFAERYAYLPTAGMTWLVVGLAAALARRLGVRMPRAATVGVVVLLAAPAAVTTVRRNADWHDDLRIAEAILRTEPRAETAYLLLTTWYSERGEPERALEVAERGLDVLPNRPELRAGATRLRLELGHIDAEHALAEYQRFVEEYSRADSVWFNLGQAYLQLDRLDEARDAFRHSLELYPNSDGAVVALAVIASLERRDAEAVELCRRAIAIYSRSMLAWQQLGVSLLRLDDVPGAVEALERAVEIAPREPDALARLGVAYARAGRLEQARRSWNTALEIDPAHAAARRNLERLERQQPR